MGNYAKFKATLAKVTVNGKEAQVILKLTNKELAKHYLSLVGSIDEEIDVAVGSPQLSMEDLGVNIPERGRIVGTIGPGGVVESAKAEDGDQLELEDVAEGQGPEEDADQDSPYEVGSEDLDDETSFDDLDFDDPVEAEGTVDDGEYDAELIEAIDRGDYHPNNEDAAVIEPTKEQLEEYILERKPAFTDIPYDFPELLERKQKGETWIQISSSIGVTSGKLSTAWSTYREKVKEKMIG